MNRCPVSRDQWGQRTKEMQMFAFTLIGALFVALFLAALVSGEAASTR